MRLKQRWGSANNWAEKVRGMGDSYIAGDEVNNK